MGSMCCTPKDITFAIPDEQHGIFASTDSQNQISSASISKQEKQSNQKSLHSFKSQTQQQQQQPQQYPSIKDNKMNLVQEKDQQQLHQR